MKKTRKEKGKRLENWIAMKLREAGDVYARPTRGSGNATEIGDIYSNYFFVECKSRNAKNIVMPIQVIEHLKNQIPINSDRMPFWAFENIDKKKFIIMEGNLYFKILKPYIEKNKEFK